MENLNLDVKKEMKRLRALLRMISNRQELPNLINIAKEASYELTNPQDYHPSCDVFCDGIELKFWNVSAARVIRDIDDLKNEASGRISGFTVKNITVSRR